MGCGEQCWNSGHSWLRRVEQTRQLRENYGSQPIRRCWRHADVFTASEEKQRSTGERYQLRRPLSLSIRRILWVQVCFGSFFRCDSVMTTTTLSLSLSPPPSRYISLSLFLSLSFFLSLYLFLSLSLSLSLSPSPFLSFSLSFSLFFSFTQAFCYDQIVDWITLNLNWCYN